MADSASGLSDQFRRRSSANTRSSISPQPQSQASLSSLSAWQSCQPDNQCKVPVSYKDRDVPCTMRYYTAFLDESFRGKSTRFADLVSLFTSASPTASASLPHLAKYCPASQSLSCIVFTLPEHFVIRTRGLRAMKAPCLWFSTVLAQTIDAASLPYPSTIPESRSTPQETSNPWSLEAIFALLSILLMLVGWAGRRWIIAVFQCESVVARSLVDNTEVHSSRYQSVHES